MEHTPGEWRVGKPESKGRDLHMGVIMTEKAMATEDGMWPCYDVICDVGKTSSIRIPREEMVANARLIAAAPELLKICLRIDAELGEPESWKDVAPDTHDDLRAVIAKARGQ